MWDGLFDGLAAVLVGYWLLWLLGLPLPGVSRREFRGWLYLVGKDKR